MVTFIVNQFQPIERYKFKVFLRDAHWRRVQVSLDVEPFKSFATIPYNMGDYCFIRDIAALDAWFHPW